MYAMFTRRAVSRLAWPVERARSYSAANDNLDAVKVVEVGPRDGLQNEKRTVPTETKIDFINRLSATGLSSIEVTSFVSPKWIPQMADNARVLREIERRDGVSYPVLVPNLRGLRSAVEANAREIAVFCAASEAFSRTNTNCSVDESVKNLTAVIEEARKHGINVRGYVSCIVGCPYEGETRPIVTARLTSTLLELGCYEVSLGDTIGVATPGKIKRLLNELRCVNNDASQYALHCHDTYGQALANVYAAVEEGVRVFDSSVAGLGGCPYAAGASGNLATEDLLYFLHGQGLETGVNFDEIVEIGDYISKQLGRVNQSRAGTAVLAKKNDPKKC